MKYNISVRIFRSSILFIYQLIKLNSKMKTPVPKHSQHSSFDFICKSSSFLRDQIFIRNSSDELEMMLLMIVTIFHTRRKTMLWEKVWSSAAPEPTVTKKNKSAVEKMKFWQTAVGNGPFVPLCAWPK